MTKTLQLYRWLIKHLEPALQKLVQKRIAKGKEDEARVSERYGIAGRERPAGPLIWLHAASVGEAQSALILVDTLLERLPEVHILVTSGTHTSASMMEQKLPERAFHQYYPLDHPDWVCRFLDHWQPNFVFWMESELWPNMLLDIQARRIPAVLVNARLSDKSFRRWRFFRKSIHALLQSFDLVLAQTARDCLRFQDLGAGRTLTTDNLKYSARPLPCPEERLEHLSAKLLGRKSWVYASTHAGEELMACRLHQILKSRHPDLLTIIVPRHPERREEIEALCEDQGLRTLLRGSEYRLPEHDVDIYVADTLGELGLFYRLCPIACIGRSFSDDGGGGHNPLEAAQLNCAVLHGPNVQYQRDIYDDMHGAQAALQLKDEDHFLSVMQDLLEHPENLRDLQQKAATFARSKTGVIDTVMAALEPLLQESGLESSDAA